MTTEMLTPDEIKGLVKLVGDWESSVWLIGGKINDGLKVVIDKMSPWSTRKYCIIVGTPNQYNETNYGICPVLGKYETVDEDIHQLYQDVMKKEEDKHNAQHDNARYKKWRWLLLY